MMYGLSTSTLYSSSSMPTSTQEQVPTATTEIEKNLPLSKQVSSAEDGISSDIKAMLTPGEKVLYKTAPYSLPIGVLFFF